MNQENRYAMHIIDLNLNIPLLPYQIPALRGSIVELVGREHEIFHNHANAEGPEKHHYDYPLVQYSVRHGKAHILGIGPGAAAVREELLPKLFGQLHLAGRVHELVSVNASNTQHNWEISGTPQEYGLRGWLALNNRNFRDWKSTSLETARLAVLNRALTGHLRVMAKAMGVSFIDQVHGQVLRVDNQKRVQFLGTQFVRFHVLFNSTLTLPYHIGLGRSAAFGFGEVQTVEHYREYTKGRTPLLAAM